MNNVRRATAHSFRALLEAALIASLLVVVVAGTAFAGKPGASGGTSTSSLSVKMVVDQGADGAPNWNDQVTFNVNTSATTKPWVKLNCYQGSAWVSTSSAGFFPDYPWAPTFTLASGGWMSGAADCTATLYMVTSNGRSKTLATLNFHVGA